MYEIGLSTWGDPPYEQDFKSYVEAGISFIEISASSNKYDGINYKEIKRLSESYGIKLWSFHLPFMPFEILDISSPDREKRNYATAYLSELIKKAGEIGITKFTIHPSGEPISDNARAEHMKYSKESLLKLYEVAAKYDGTLMVEDLPRSCLGKNSSEILELISVHPNIGVCFDTNHLLSEDTVDFVKNVGSKIMSLHVSDYDKVNERHWLPGEGIIDWQALYSAIKSTGYNGPWLYEIGFKAPDSITRPRDLVCSDFVRNADEIFSGSPITLIK